MKHRKRMNRWDQEVGTFDERMSSGTSRVALPAMSDCDLRRLQRIAEFQIKQPEAVLGQIARSIVEFGFIDPALMVGNAGIVAGQKRRDCDGN